MNARDTRTGAVLEQMILPALRQGGYHYRKGALVGARLGTEGRKHKIDIFVWDDHFDTHLVSLKWQQTSGTAEQKVPYEVMALADILLLNQRDFRPSRKRENDITCHDCGAVYRNVPARALSAHLVIGGDKWTLRSYYLSGELSQHMQHSDLVNMRSLEEFVASANTGKL